MSYDLDIRTKPPYGPGIPLEQMASELLDVPGVTRPDVTTFLLDRHAAGVHVFMTVAFQESEEDEDEGAEMPTAVNVVYLSIPYPLLDQTWPVAMNIVRRITARFGWSAYDPQTESDLTSESVPLPVDIEQLVRGTSLLDLFMQHMWPRHLWSAAICLALGMVLAIWLLLILERPREDFDRYAPYLAIGGAVVVSIAKGAAQTIWHYLKPLAS